MTRSAHRGAHGRPLPDGPAPFTTLVELTFDKRKVEHWIRFGRKSYEQILDRRQVGDGEAWHGEGAAEHPRRMSGVPHEARQARAERSRGAPGRWGYRSSRVYASPVAVA